MNHDQTASIVLIYTITNLGVGSKILKSAKNHGISGGTILLAKGTANNSILDYLGLADLEKEIVLMISDQQTAHQALEKLSVEFKLEKPNHGIAFTTSIGRIIGTRSCSNNVEEKDGFDNSMFDVITIIVDKGNAEDVMDAAKKAGSKGGTIINGRGSGIHETSKLFSMEIEPEKEVVLMLSEESKTEAIIASIKDALKIDEPGNGIIYVQKALRTYGVLK